MKELRLALFAEGTTDEQFLSSILQRTCQQVIARHSNEAINVLDTRVIKKQKSLTRRDECIFQAARDAVDYHILIVHTDADHHTQEKALNERFLPGYHLVQNSNERVCKHLVPVVPIHMTEAWLLVDADALRDVIGTNMKAQKLGLAYKAKQIEADANPKQTLRTIVQKANANRSKRHRETDMSAFYRLLGRQARLDHLDHLQAYQQFKKDLTETLQLLSFIHS